jgi:hypothetical protein
LTCIKRLPGRRPVVNRTPPAGPALLLAIMLTDFAFDGFRFARLAAMVPGIAHEQEQAFVGGAVAPALGGGLAAPPGGAVSALTRVPGPRLRPGFSTGRAT